MNIKKMFLVSLVLIAMIWIITPVNGKLDSTLELESSKTFNGKTELNLQVYSNIGMKNKNYYSYNYIFKRKTELNKINKVLVTIKGYKTITFKKPVKGWNSDFYGYSFDVSFLVKGKTKNIANKDCSIELYDKKNKLIKNKKSKVLFSQWTSGTGISNNPKLYFNKVKTQKKKNKQFTFGNFYQGSTQSYWNVKNPILSASSNVNYYYNKNSDFKKEIKTEHTYFSYLHYKTESMENKKIYTNGKYTLTTYTYKNGKKGLFKYLILEKKLYETQYNSTKNPYFTISKECNWTNPSIMNLAMAIKTNVSRSNYANNDIYNMELANAVIKYVHEYIKYDYDYSPDQSAITTLQRGKGTCLGNSMLAGALLRALGIPTYFKSSYNKTSDGNREMGHIWPVSYIFYENKYQWVPAEPTHDFTNNIYYTIYYSNLEKYKYPFHKNALDWWIKDSSGKYDFTNTYSYYYDT
ncbi:MAG: transglutaminase-like domain-containing protein [Methanobacteriaceae archaeon]|nr:transglutaminase-like domain-containing protein [Candidatus Methanorudis spinitermitis]